MTREKLQADGNPYPDGYPPHRLLDVAVELDRRLKVLEAELVQTRAERDKLNQTVAYLQGFWVPERVQELIAERDAALKLVDDTLEALGASLSGNDINTRLARRFDMAVKLKRKLGRSPSPAEVDAALDEVNA
jgi:vacuolar-type H+-ATPase subunit I/STV1